MTSGLLMIAGKSGALNLVWPQTQGDILAVFDADAHVPNDLLCHVVPMFDPALGAQAKTCAVQVRKAIANAGTTTGPPEDQQEQPARCLRASR